MESLHEKTEESSPEAVQKENCTQQSEAKMRGLAFSVKPVLVIGAQATQRILRRHGIGPMKLIDVAHLWLQRTGSKSAASTARTILLASG